MKKLGISVVALMIGLPTMARATISTISDAGTATPNTNVATTSYVQGAYNSMASAVNTAIGQANTDIAAKQDQLTAGGNNVSATVKTSVGAATGQNAATDTALVTEKAVRDAIDAAGGQTAQQVEDAIDAAAGAGIATDGSGTLSIDLTSNGGLELTGSGDAATVGVKVDGTHVVKDASGNVTLSTTDINNLTAAGTALQASDLDGTTLEKDGTTNKVQVVAGSIGTTQLSSGVVTSLGLADTALQAADLAGYGFNVYGNWATPSTSTGSVTVTNSNLTANN